MSLSDKNPQISSLLQTILHLQEYLLSLFGSPPVFLCVLLTLFVLPLPQTLSMHKFPVVPEEDPLDDSMQLLTALSQM